MFDPTLTETTAYKQRLFWYVAITIATTICLVLSISFARIEFISAFATLFVSSGMAFWKSRKTRTEFKRKLAIFDAGTTAAVMLFSGTIALFQAKGYMSIEMGENLFLTYICLFRLIISILFTKTF